MTILIFEWTIPLRTPYKCFCQRYSESDLVLSYGWCACGEGDMVYVYRGKVTWFMSAVMLVLWFLLHAVICISDLWHDSNLTGLQLSAQQSRHPITNTVCHTERDKVQKRWSRGEERVQKQSKIVAETKKDETERLVSTARFSAGVFHDKWDDA